MRIIFDRDQTVLPPVGTHLLQALLTVALATCLELAVRAAAPLPYAPRAADIILSFLLYGLVVVPALVLARLGQRFRKLARFLLGGPFGLVLANLAFAFGNESRLIFLLTAVSGLGLGGLVMWTTSPRVLATAAALCFAFWGVARSRPARDEHPGPQRSLLLVVLDTTAASHLSAYGYGKPTSPKLEALARRSLVYRRAISTAPWTVPSHAAIFSGRYPSQLGFDGGTFDADLMGGSIAADAAATGRTAVGITANPIVATDPLRRGFDAIWGEAHVTRPLLTREFHRVLDAYRAGHPSNEQSRGERITDLALDWVDRLAPAGRPWFVLLNYLDPHAPYCPPERERRQFAPGIDPDSIAHEAQVYNSGKLPLTGEVSAAIRALYDGEVAATDRAVGRLLDELGRRGYNASNLFVIVTADHGESLGEHGILGHQLGLPDAVLHVPLLISGPGVQPGVIASPVQTVQLRATVHALLGIKSGPEIAPPLPPWGVAPALLISQHPFPRWYHDELHDWNPHFNSEPWEGDWVAVERDGVKVVFNDRGSGSFYDLHADPGEQDPRPVSNGAELVQAYRALPIASRPRRPGVLSEEARSVMRSLGYIQ